MSVDGDRQDQHFSSRLQDAGESLVNLLQFFFFENENRIVGKFYFVQRYPPRVNVSRNMLRELAHINPVTDFAAHRVLILHYNRIAFSQLKHERKTFVEPRIIDLDRLHGSYHCWFSPFFKGCNADPTIPACRTRRSLVAYGLRFFAGLENHSPGALGKLSKQSVGR